MLQLSPGSSGIIPETRPEEDFQCIGSIPANSYYCSDDRKDLSRSLRLAHVDACTESRKCEFRCRNGFEYAGGVCRRVQTTGNGGMNNSGGSNNSGGTNPGAAPSRDGICRVDHYENGLNRKSTIEIREDYQGFVHARGEAGRSMCYPARIGSETRRYEEITYRCTRSGANSVRAVEVRRSSKTHFLDRRCDSAMEQTQLYQVTNRNVKTANRFNIVYVPDDSKLSNKLRRFDQSVQAVMNDMLDEEPYRSYRSFFTVRTIRVPHTADEDYLQFRGSVTSANRLREIVREHGINADYIGLMQAGYTGNGFYGRNVGVCPSSCMFHELGHHHGLPDAYSSERGPANTTFGEGKMAANQQPFTDLQQEQVIRDLYSRYVKPIDRSYKDNARQVLVVEPMQVAHGMDIVWRAAGREFSPQNPRQVRFSEIPGRGVVEVTATVVDNIDMMKDERFRASNMTQTVSFSVNKNGEPREDDEQGGSSDQMCRLPHYANGGSERSIKEIQVGEFKWRHLEGRLQTKSCPNGKSGNRIYRVFQAQKVECFAANDEDGVRAVGNSRVNREILVQNNCR